MRWKKNPQPHVYCIQISLHAGKWHVMWHSDWWHCIPLTLCWSIPLIKLTPCFSLLWCDLIFYKHSFQTFCYLKYLLYLSTLTKALWTSYKLMAITINWKWYKKSTSIQNIYGAIYLRDLAAAKENTRHLFSVVCIHQTQWNIGRAHFYPEMC